MPKTPIRTEAPAIDRAALRLVLAGSVYQVDSLQHWRNTERQVVLNRIKPFDFLLVPLRGAMELRLGGRRELLRPGRCLAIAAGVEHDGLRPHDQPALEALTVHCRISAPAAPRLLAALAHPVLPAPAAWRRELVAATALDRERDPVAREWAADLLRRLLVAAVLADEPLDTTGVNPLVERSARLLEDHPELTIAAVARRCGCTPGRLRQLYAQAFDQSPADYRTARRLREACGRLRRSDATIAAIAEASGFGTTRAMQQAFQRHLAMTPQAYRDAGTG